MNSTNNELAAGDRDVLCYNISIALSVLRIYLFSQCCWSTLNGCVISNTTKKNSAIALHSHACHSNTTWFFFQIEFHSFHFVNENAMLYRNFRFNFHDRDKKMYFCVSLIILCWVSISIDATVCPMKINRIKSFDFLIVELRIFISGKTHK